MTSTKLISCSHGPADRQRSRNESRFQRCVSSTHRFPGALPQAADMNAAPLARNRYALDASGEGGIS